MYGYGLKLEKVGRSSLAVNAMPPKMIKKMIVVSVPDEISVISF